MKRDNNTTVHTTNAAQKDSDDGKGIPLNKRSRISGSEIPNSVNRTLKVDWSICKGTKPQYDTDTSQLQTIIKHGGNEMSRTEALTSFRSVVVLNLSQIRVNRSRSTVTRLIR